MGVFWGIEGFSGEIAIVGCRIHQKKMQVSSVFPDPPHFYKLYTDANLRQHQLQKLHKHNHTHLDHHHPTSKDNHKDLANHGNLCSFFYRLFYLFFNWDVFPHFGIIDMQPELDLDPPPIIEGEYFLFGETLTVSNNYSSLTFGFRADALLFNYN